MLSVHFITSYIGVKHTVTRTKKQTKKQQQQQQQTLQKTKKNKQPPTNPSTRSDLRMLALLPEGICDLIKQTTSNR